MKHLKQKGVNYEDKPFFLCPLINDRLFSAQWSSSYSPVTHSSHITLWSDSPLKCSVQIIPCGSSLK